MSFNNAVFNKKIYIGLMMGRSLFAFFRVGHELKKEIMSGELSIKDLS